MGELQELALIHDWNIDALAVSNPRDVAIVDETLYNLHAIAREGRSRDALSEGQPDLSALVDLLRCCERLKMYGANLGALNERTLDSIAAVARTMAGERLGIVPICTILADPAYVALAARVAQSAGCSLALSLFIPTSALTHYADGTSLDSVLSAMEGTLVAATREGFSLRIMGYDASRAHPAALRRFLCTACEHGVTRFCAWDSAGCSSPAGVARLLRFMREVADERGSVLHIEWFGRNDRDLAIVNCLEALRHGADTIHGTALGLGHGAGYAALDTLLPNLQLCQLIDRDLSSLPQYCRTAARVCGVIIPVNYPIFGSDAFRTATGVHAAAIVKAQMKGDRWLADRVYSGVPAGLFGLHQVIDVGPMSGESNVVAWLRHRNIEPRSELVKAILRRAKSSTHILTEAEMKEEIEAFATHSEC